METSTVVPRGDMSTLDRAYERGLCHGSESAFGFIVALALGVVLCAWAFFDADKRADRAEAQLAEMRAQQLRHTCVSYNLDHGRDMCMCQHEVW